MSQNTFFHRVFALALFALIALVTACSPAVSGATRTDNQWTVTTVTTKDATGTVTRADVSGYFIFRSDGTYLQNIVLSRVARIQESSYSVTDTTLTLVQGQSSLVYTFSVSADGKTMTWDAQDDTSSHWVFALASTVDEPI